jgi:uncharacterized membrane protein
MAIAVWIAASAAPQAAPAAPQIYELVGIGFLPMNKEPADPNASFAHDVNVVGGEIVVVGQSTTSIGSPPEVATSDFHAVRFTLSTGGLEDLGDLDSGGDTSAAYGINASGVIVGRGDAARDPGATPPDLSDATHAARWMAPSAIEDIGVGSEFGVATAINESGNAVGNVGSLGAQEGFFRTPGGAMTTLPNPAGGTRAFAEDLNGANRIVGHAAVAGVQRALLWDGAAAPLELGDLDGDGGESAAFGINAAGWIAGSSDDDGQQRACRRDPGNGALEGLAHLPGGDFSRARDINGSGIAVGSALDPTAHEFHAVLWDSDGAVYDLHDLLTNGSGWVLEEALAISETGHIVGQARNPAGRSEGFVLKPLPEPGALASLVCGLTLVAALGRRARGQSAS